MTPEETVDEFIARVVGLDLDAACELLTDDVEYDNVPMGKNIGPDALKAFLGGMGTGVDEVQFVVHRQAASGDVVINERTDRFRVGERWFDLPVAGVFELRDGKIALWRDYFDMAPVNEMLASFS
jgi:limonene-1,2-epoxide hydrolase